MTDSIETQKDMKEIDACPLGGGGGALLLLRRRGSLTLTLSPRVVQQFKLLPSVDTNSNF